MIAKPTLAIDGGTPISKKLIQFGSPVFGKEEEEALIKTLRSGWVGFGPKCLEFELKFRAFTGSQWALSSSSCTAALHMSLIVNGLKPGDEVITTPLTFAATINAIHQTGARLVLVDIDAETLNIDCGKIEQAITSKTKAILPVHYAGLPVEINTVEAIASKNNLSVIYDAAHAVGATYQSVNVGSRDHISCFSFYANKNMTTVDGGMLTGNNLNYVDKVETLRLHGMDHHAWKRYRNKELIMDEVKGLGFKYNLNDLNASIGLVQLERLNSFLKRREEIAELYEGLISHEPTVSFQYRDKSNNRSRHALHLFVIILDLDAYSVDRNQIVAALRSENIGASIHYRPVHMHRFYRDQFGLDKVDYPVASKVGSSVITLPISPALSDEDIECVVEGLFKVINHYKP